MYKRIFTAIAAGVTAAMLIFGSFAATTATTADDTAPDPANFPNEEITKAEEVWQHFAYKHEYGAFTPKYLSLYNSKLKRNLFPEESPEIDWYFPYFIDFCKQTNLLIDYTPKPNFSEYDLIISDFREYYLEHSGYKEVNHLGYFFVPLPNPQSPIPDCFRKVGDNWELVKPYIDNGKWTVNTNDIENPNSEVILTIPSIGDNPFDKYKDKSVPAEAKQSDIPQDTPYTVNDTVSVSGNSTEQQKSGSNPAVTVAIIGGAVVVGGVIGIAAVKLKGGKK